MTEEYVISYNNKKILCVKDYYNDMGKILFKSGQYYSFYYYSTYMGEHKHSVYTKEDKVYFREGKFFEYFELKTLQEYRKEKIEKLIG